MLYNTFRYTYFFLQCRLPIPQFNGSHCTFLIVSKHVIESLSQFVRNLLNLEFLSVDLILNIINSLVQLSDIHLSILIPRQKKSVVTTKIVLHLNLHEIKRWNQGSVWISATPPPFKSEISKIYGVQVGSRLQLLLSPQSPALKRQKNVLPPWMNSCVRP